MRGHGINGEFGDFPIVSIFLDLLNVGTQSATRVFQVFLPVAGDFMIQRAPVDFIFVREITLFSVVVVVVILSNPAKNIFLA